MSQTGEKKTEKKKKDNRIHRRLSAKVIYLLTGMGLLLTGLVIFIGAVAFQKAIATRYDESAYQVAETASEYFLPDEIYALSQILEQYEKGEIDDAEVKEQVTDNARYQEVKRLMQGLRENFNANDVFISVINQDELGAYTPEAREAGTWKPVHYIMDCYHNPEEDMPFGGLSGVVPEYREDVMEALNTGVRPTTHMITDTKWGYNMSAMLPIKRGDKTVAVVGVEIPMSTLKGDTYIFILKIALSGLLVMILAVLVGWRLTRRMIVKPIELVAHEANHFVSEKASVSDKLPSIKTKDEIQMLSESLLTMELSINDYIDNIREITKEKERIGAELNVATRIQASMLPTDFNAYDAFGAFKLHASMNPAKEVGGDFYDFFLVDGSHFATVMADVSGKGVPAALFMVRAMTAIRTRAMMGGSPSDILSDVNDQLCVGNEEELFVTVWLAIFDFNTGEGLAANAGHEHPALCHADGTYELVKYRHGPAVATMEGIMFREHEFKLEPGDTFFVYTDGVTEATDANNELFGEERLTAALNRNLAAEPEGVLANVKAGIDEFVGTAPQFDDITMLALRWK